MKFDMTALKAMLKAPPGGDDMDERELLLSHLAKITRALQANGTKRP